MAGADELLFALKLVSALGCGLIAGTFFAFSSFVMKALARLPPSEGIAAMNSVNVAVLNPLFLGVFVGTAVACAVAIVFSVLRWHAPGSGYLLAGSLLYLVGTFLVTMVFNVPRNEALALVAPANPDSARLWAEYLSSWTAWNHVRTAAALAAAASFTISFRY
ncbi:MAG TPA: anthrone oxygenase family protein [Thermoanaerobaculia bacterium]|nr:anthrone oxygenase family protein [Thermoanaerobaculia bacterium]